VFVSLPSNVGQAPAAQRPAPSPGTYRAQRPTLPDLPPIVVTASGPAWPLLAALVGLLPMVLWFIGIDRQMWIDEYVTFYVTKLSWAEFGQLIRNQDLVHGAYYVFMRIWTEMAGTSLTGLRLPSMLGMCLAAGGLTLLGRRLFGTRAGLLAGIVFALLPTVSRYGQEARSYALVSGFAVLSTLVLTYAIQRLERRWWLLYTVVTIVLVYLHAVAALMLLPHALLVLHGWRRERERAMGWWLVCVTLVVGAAAPLLYFAKGQSAQVDWITADSAAVRRYPEELFGSNLVTVAVVVLALVGAIRLVRRRAGNMLVVLVWAVFPPVFCYLTFDVAHLFLAKYALFALPAWALLIGGVMSVPPPPVRPAVPDDGTPAWRAAPARRPWLTRPTAALLVAVATVVAVAGFSGQRELRRSPLAAEPDFRGAAAVVEQGFREGDGIVYVGTDRWARIPFVYELRTAHPRDVFVGVPMAENGRFYPQECTDPAQCLGTTSRVWLVVSNYSDDDFNGLPPDQATLLKAQYTATTTTTLENARVVLLQRKQR
jgi:mannosyltransferase